VNSVIIPLVVIRPTAGVVPRSTNQRFPSGPAVMSSGSLPGFRPTLYSVITPFVVIFPIAGVKPLSLSVNQRLPSGPAAIPESVLCALSPFENSVIVPLGVIRPIAWPGFPSVNHRFPSGCRARDAEDDDEREDGQHGRSDPATERHRDDRGLEEMHGGVPPVMGKTARRAHLGEYE
jgi:hypothetical protein